MRRDGKGPKERCCLVQKFCTFESLARPGAHERVWKGLREQKRRCKATIEIVGGIGPGMKCAEKFSQRKRCFKPSYAHSLASVLLYAFRSREKEYCLFCGFFQLEKPICYWESRHLLAPLMSQLVTFSNCSAYNCCCSEFPTSRLEILRSLTWKVQSDLYLKFASSVHWWWCFGAFFWCLKKSDETKTLADSPEHHLFLFIYSSHCFLCIIWLCRIIKGRVSQNIFILS